MCCDRVERAVPVKILTLAIDFPLLKAYHTMQRRGVNTCETALSSGEYASGRRLTEICVASRIKPCCGL